MRLIVKSREAIGSVGSNLSLKLNRDEVAKNNPGKSEWSDLSETTDMVAASVYG